VLFLDLDRFKPVNDRYGHATGDALLVAVTTRLKDSVRSGDLVSRFGGDEFLVLCSALISREQAHDVAERIEQAVSTPFESDGHVLSISASIGIAYHSGGDALIDANSLVNHADLAMYEAKRLGRPASRRPNYPHPSSPGRSRTIVRAPPQDRRRVRSSVRRQVGIVGHLSSEKCRRVVRAVPCRLPVCRWSWLPPPARRRQHRNRRRPSRRRPSRRRARRKPCLRKRVPPPRPANTAPSNMAPWRVAFLHVNQ
jgi:diguanylate cyclase (GGDEF)-like protein